MTGCFILWTKGSVPSYTGDNRTLAYRSHPLHEDTGKRPVWD